MNVQNQESEKLTDDLEDGLLAEFALLNLETPEFLDSNMDKTFSLEKLLEEFNGDSGNLHSNVNRELSANSSSQAKSKSDRKPLNNNFILRCTKVQGISNHISNAVERTNAGLPTSCAVSMQIAVGTSHGHILNFNFSQNLTWVYEDTKSQGAVSALAFNKDCTHLLAGFAGGFILIIDAVSGNVLKCLADILTPDAGVLHVKWTSYVELILCVDTSGSLWSLNLMRKLNKRYCAPQCLLHGTQGEVLVVEPLSLNFLGSYHFDQHSIIAFATATKYYVAMLRPHFKVIKQIKLQESTRFLPLISWQIVIMKATEFSRTVEPILVVGKSNKLFFHQLYMACGKISLISLRCIDLDYNLISLHWIGPKCIACIDSSEILHLVDIRSEKNLECFELAEVGLIYGSYIFKGLATGCNVSTNMALAGVNACFYSIVSYDTNIFLLGSRSLYLISVRTWMERVGYLIKNQRVREAFELAISEYKIASDRPKQKAQAKERILFLFKEYLKKSQKVLNNYLSEAIKCLIYIGEIELLFTLLWDRLEDKDDFLKIITNYIESEMIQTVPTHISQDLVNYWIKTSPSKLSDILIKLDWRCLDLDQVLKITKQHCLYAAYIYLNTHPLNDYTTFLIELIPLVDAANPELGNCLLVYLSSVLTGRAYPFGNIATERKHAVRNKVLQTLLARRSVGESLSELPYPYLRKMLQFNARATLNVLTLVFQEQEIASHIICRKDVVNILLEILANDQSTWVESGCVLNYVTQQLLEQNLLHDKSILKVLLGYLSMENITNETLQQRFEREKVWQELLSKNCFQFITKMDDQLALATRAHCYFVQEYILEQQHKYDCILNCYLNNQLKHKMIFKYIESHIEQPERAIREQVRKHFVSLLRIDASKSTHIILTYMASVIDDILLELKCDNISSRLFLQNLHQQQSYLSEQQLEQYLKLLCQDNNKELLMDVLSKSNNYNIENALQIVQSYNMTDAMLYLYEKQGKFFNALDLYIVTINETTANDEKHKLMKYIGKFCARASKHLNKNDREIFWIQVIQFISQNNFLQTITKEMLHEACQSVDAHKITEMIMSKQNLFCDFKNKRELLAMIISTLRQKMHLKKFQSETSSEENHKLLHTKHIETYRGLWVTFASCIICCNDLNEDENIYVIGKCKHAIHCKCFKNSNSANTLHNFDLNQVDLKNYEQRDERSYKCLSCHSRTTNTNAVKLLTFNSCKKNQLVNNLSCTLQKPCLLQLKVSPKRYNTN